MYTDWLPHPTALPFFAPQTASESSTEQTPGRLVEVPVPPHQLSLLLTRWGRERGWADRGKTKPFFWATECYRVSFSANRRFFQRFLSVFLSQFLPPPLRFIKTMTQRQTRASCAARRSPTTRLTFWWSGHAFWWHAFWQIGHTFWGCPFYNGPTWPHKLSRHWFRLAFPVSSPTLWHHHSVSSTTLWHNHTVPSPTVWHDHTVSPIFFYFYVFYYFVPLSKLKLVSFYPP